MAEQTPGLAGQPGPGRDEDWAELLREPRLRAAVDSVRRVCGVRPASTAAHAAGPAARLDSSPAQASRTEWRTGAPRRRRAGGSAEVHGLRARRVIPAPRHRARGRLAAGMTVALILHVAVFLALISGQIGHILPDGASAETVIGRLVDGVVRTLEAGQGPPAPAVGSG